MKARGMNSPISPDPDRRILPSETDPSLAYPVQHVSQPKKNGDVPFKGMPCCYNPVHVSDDTGCLCRTGAVLKVPNSNKKQETFI